MTLIDQNVETTDNGSITVEEAHAILADQRQKRVDSCRDEIQAALEKYRCAIEPYVVIRRGAVMPQIEIVAND